MVYAAFATADWVYPLAVAIASMVSDAVTATGALYNVEPEVGAVPSVV
jgi:hypothetical protein